MTSRKPPSQRNAEFYDQRRARQLQSMVPGTLEGRLADAQPFKQFSGPPDALFGFDGGAVAQATRASQIDQFTLASAGAQDLTLTYVPVPMSWNVEHNTLGLLDTTNYTISSNVLSLISGVDSLEIGDTIQVQYDYLEEQADPIGDESEINIPFQSGGWSYIGSASPAARTTQMTVATDFSSWAVGTAPLGWNTYVDVDGHPKATELPHVNTGELGHEWDAVIRRAMPGGTGIVVTVDETNFCDVYADTTLIAFSSSGGALKLSSSPFDMAGPWDLIIRLTSGAGVTNGGIDIEVTGTAL
jgi:hypothetical protein